MSTPPAAPTVAVRGEWTAEVPPELARVRVAVGARGYAGGAGPGLTGRVETADPGLSGSPVAVAPAAFLSGARQEAVAFDVEPVPQTVHAAVEARFTLTQPDFD